MYTRINFDSQEALIAIFKDSVRILVSDEHPDGNVLLKGPHPSDAQIGPRPWSCAATIKDGIVVQLRP